jgi:hypothetical protein
MAPVHPPTNPSHVMDKSAITQLRSMLPDAFAEDLTHYLNPSILSGSLGPTISSSSSRNGNKGTSNSTSEPLVNNSQQLRM